MERNHIRHVYPDVLVFAFVLVVLIHFDIVMICRSAQQRHCCNTSHQVFLSSSGMFRMRLAISYLHLCESKQSEGNDLWKYAKV